LEELDVTDVFKICSEKEARGIRVINAHIGAPSHLPPIPISRLLKEIESTGLKYLPFEGLRVARERISEFARKFLGREMDPERIFVTNGGAQALTSTLLALRDRKVLLPAPGFTQYFDNARIMGLRFSTYNSTAEDIISEILSKLGDAGAVLINYPNNPTGYMPSNDSLYCLWEELKRKGVLLINDAAYSQIYFDFKPEIPGDIVIDTFSKTLGIPGLRIGYVYWGIGETRAIFDAVYITSAGVSEISQLVLSTLLSSLTKEYLENVRQYYKSKRDFIVKLMREYNFSFPEPRGAFYIFAKHSKIKDANLLARRLLSREDLVVGIVPGSVFRSDSNYFRICYSTLTEKDAEDMVRLIMEEARLQ